MNNPSSISEEQLVESIKSSQVEAFKTLYYRYYNDLYRFFWLRINSKDSAKDLIHDVFIRIWENRHNLDGKKSIKAYIYRIANNLLIDFFRKKSSQRTYIAEDASVTDVSTEESLEQVTAVKLAINNLPEKIRSVFILSRYQGLKYAEIAQALNISIKTVESRICKAFRLLREDLS